MKIKYNEETIRFLIEKNPSFNQYLSLKGLQLAPDV